MPPYDILRKLIKTFGMDEIARARFEKQIAREKAAARGRGPPTSEGRTETWDGPRGAATRPP